jgi:hypothetical protein
LNCDLHYNVHFKNKQCFNVISSCTCMSCFLHGFIKGCLLHEHLQYWFSLVPSLHSTVVTEVWYHPPIYQWKLHKLSRLCATALSTLKYNKALRLKFAMWGFGVQATMQTYEAMVGLACVWAVSAACLIILSSHRDITFIYRSRFAITDVGHCGCPQKFIAQWRPK